MSQISAVAKNILSHHGALKTHTGIDFCYDGFMDGKDINPETLSQLNLDSKCSGEPTLTLITDVPGSDKANTLADWVPLFANHLADTLRTEFESSVKTHEPFVSSDSRWAVKDPFPTDNQPVAFLFRVQCNPDLAFPTTSQGDSDAAGSSKTLNHLPSFIITAPES